MASNKTPAQPSAQLPKGKPCNPAARGVLVAAHVNAYLAKLPAKQRAQAMALPAAQVAASAGCALYAQQYAYRNHLRKSGQRVRGNGGNWGTAAGKVQTGALGKANKLVPAANAGANQAKGQAKQHKAATAEPTAQAAEATAQASE